MFHNINSNNNIYIEAKKLDKRCQLRLASIARKFRTSQISNSALKMIFSNRYSFLVVDIQMVKCVIIQKSYSLKFRSQYFSSNVLFFTDKVIMCQDSINILFTGYTGIVTIKLYIRIFSIKHYIEVFILRYIYIEVLH